MALLFAVRPRQHAPFFRPPYFCRRRQKFFACRQECLLNHTLQTYFKKIHARHHTQRPLHCIPSPCPQVRTRNSRNNPTADRPEACSIQPTQPMWCPKAKKRLCPRANDTHERLRPDSPVTIFDSDLRAHSLDPFPFISRVRAFFAVAILLEQKPFGSMRLDLYAPWL